MTINDTGLMVSVEESHTLLGRWMLIFLTISILLSGHVAAAWVAKELFDEFDYHFEAPSSQSSEQPNEPVHTALCFKLHTLLECLNIFGTAHGNSASQASKHVWKRKENTSDAEGEGGTAANDQKNRGRGNARIDNFFPKVDGKGNRNAFIVHGSRLSFENTSVPTVFSSIGISSDQNY